MLKLYKKMLVLRELQYAKYNKSLNPEDLAKARAYTEVVTDLYKALEETHKEIGAIL